MMYHTYSSMCTLKDTSELGSGHLSLKLKPSTILSVIYDSARSLRVPVGGPMFTKRKSEECFFIKGSLGPTWFDWY